MGRRSEHQFERFVGEFLGLYDAALGNAQNDAGEFQARGFYRLGALADLRCNRLPSFLKGFFDGLELLPRLRVVFGPSWFPPKTPHLELSIKAALML